MMNSSESKDGKALTNNEYILVSEFSVELFK